MLRIDKTHSMDEYLSVLRSSDKIFIDNERLDQAIMDAQYTADDYRMLAQLELRIESSGKYFELSPETILDYLDDVGVDLEKRFRNRKTKGPSLDIHKVVNPMIEAGIAVNILTAYKSYRSYRSYSSFLRQLGNQRNVVGTTTQGHRILQYDTHIAEQDNMRAYYSDIAVVSIPRIYSSIVTAPSENYHLAWCDYPQADWRFAYNLFIKDDKNRKVMQECDDAYEGLARLVEGADFDPAKFKTLRKDYKVNALSVFYNSRDSRPIPVAMRNFFQSCDKYKKYKYDLGVLSQFNLRIPCVSYFGYEQFLPEASYPDAFISKGLNTPIQTFTSHIVNETVLGILDKFWGLGYTSEDINVYYVRHDEPIFMFKDCIIKDSWIFKECSEIFIDGFTPIKLDFHFGNFYKEDDPGLSEQVATFINNYPDRISTFSGGEAKDYSPVPSVEQLYLQFFNSDTPGVTSNVLLYNYRVGKYMKTTVKSDDREDAVREAILNVFDKIGRPRYILVKTAGIDFIDALDTDEEEPTLLKVISRYDNNVASASFDRE